MAQQPLLDELLQWLFRVLQPEYIDPRTTYQDVAVTLQRYPTLRPRTRVYTYESGESKLLLNLHGSLPVTIQARVYKIPVELWIPLEYPLASPIAYVVPTEKMVLQPGNHVDTNGRCYLPYLASWGQGEQPSNIITLCGALAVIFSKQPPVFARPASQPASRPFQTPTSTGNSSFAPPALPPKAASQSPAVVSPTPVLPPKQASLTPQNNTVMDVTTTNPPPLPPLPEELRSKMIQSPTLNKMNEQSQMNVRPVFEQPNIMDTFTDASQSQHDRERESATERVQSLLQNIFETDVSQSLSKFSADVNQIKYAVGKFDKIFEYEFQELEKINAQISENEAALATAIQSAGETIQKANQVKEINPDEVIVAETVVYNQLYDLVADDQAIGDTIYALVKAHDHGLITLNTYIKQTRTLAREQFMKKALVVKIANQLGLMTT